jgi:hypothetical protein
MPLKPFSSDKKAALALLRSVPQEILDTIGRVTRTYIKKAIDGIAGPVRFLLSLLINER